jgi:hypothetical protein
VESEAGLARSPEGLVAGHTIPLTNYVNATTKSYASFKHNAAKSFGGGAIGLGAKSGLVAGR